MKKICNNFWGEQIKIIVFIRACFQTYRLRINWKYLAWLVPPRRGVLEDFLWERGGMLERGVPLEMGGGV